MADLRRWTPEPLPSAPEVRWTPGLGDDLTAELAPLLAEDGIDVDNLEAVDLPTLQRAWARAVERRNMALFTPVGGPRTVAVKSLRSIVAAILRGDTKRAGAMIDRVVPESPDGRKATVASCIGISLGLLDTWMKGDASGAPARLRHECRIPAGHWHGERAATDILVLAGKGRSFASLQPLIVRQGGHHVLNGSILALAGAVQAWSALSGTPVDEVIANQIV